jgi:2,3-diketo-5-methylthio-1-phosphopentane phosphatase
MSADSEYIYFCDFDGTIATEDVGYHLMTHFSLHDNADINERWLKRDIGARECLEIEASRIEATLEEMLEQAEKFVIDPAFTKFVTTAESRGERVIILSDGLDYYIKHLLEREGLSHLELHTNLGSFNGSKLSVEFPYSEGCGTCGSCKAARMREIVARESFAGKKVFVGDGYSDVCAIDEADVLFAKSYLQSYCEEERIVHIPFNSFADVADSVFG